MSKSRAFLAVVVVLVAGCTSKPSPSIAPASAASPAATATSAPAPTASGSRASAPPALLATPSPAPPPTPTSHPAKGGWSHTAVNMTEPLFGADGTVYLHVGPDDPMTATDALIALDRAGRMRSGWPLEEPEASDFGPMAVGPDGSLYVQQCGTQAVGCALRRLGIDGRDLPGWPFEMPSSFVCPAGHYCDSRLLIGPDGIAYLSSWSEVDDRTWILAVDASGFIPSGWPVSIEGHTARNADLAVSSDGTLFVQSRREEDDPAELYAVAPDGAIRPGWPVRVDGPHVLGPNGTAVISWGVDDSGELCRNFRRTVFTVIGPDGRTLDGWPRGSTGTASGPAVGADGTVYYVSALGNVYAHDLAGDVKDGWPVAVPGAHPGCGAHGPYISAAGTVYVLGDEIVAMSPNGTTWRYRPDGLLGGSSCDTDGLNRPAPAFGAGGTVFVAVFGDDNVGRAISIVALDRKGQLKPGWPVVLPVATPGSDVNSLAMSPEGVLYVTAATCQFPASMTLLALDPDR